MIMSTKEICKRGLSMTISLTLGNTTFPFAYGGRRNAQPAGRLLLRQAQLAALAAHNILKFHLAAS